MTKRIITLFITVLLVISMITGCASSSNTGTSSSSGTKSEDTENVSQDIKPRADDTVVTDKDGTPFYKTGLPIVDKPVSFTVWAVTTAADPSKFPMCKIYEEDTGISPMWITISPEGLEERKNLMWASGDYPDVLGPGVVSDQDIDTYGPMGIIIPLNEYIDEYLVNFKKYSEDKWDSIWSKLRYPDGNIYTYPTVTEYFYCDNAVPSINVTWLEKLGLEMPTTPDEFVEVLRAFKTRDPNDNKKADEIPLTAQWGALGRLLDLASWTGVIVNAQYIENGKVIWPLKTDEARKSIEWLHSIYAEDLMDPEIFTQDEATYMAKAKQAELLYGVACLWREGNTFGEEAGMNYFVMEPLKGPSGKQLAYGTKDKFLVMNQFCVTSACKVPGIVARWIDYMYDPIITIQSNHAPISVGGYIPREDGTYEKSIPEGFNTIGEYFVDNHFQQVPRLCLGKAEEIVWQNPDDYIPFKYAKGSFQKKLHDDIRGPYVIDRMPSVKPLPDEADELALLTPDFNKYCSEMLTRFITGQADINTEWEAFCAQIDKLGYEKILKIRQQQYDRYMSK